MIPTKIILTTNKQYNPVYQFELFLPMGGGSRARCISVIREMCGEDSIVQLTGKNSWIFEREALKWIRVIAPIQFPGAEVSDWISLPDQLCGPESEKPR